ncbi:MAG: hypothetical protein ACYS8W_14925 [Planctomycetota bacterium]|jgi:hypothetical protein
MDWLNKEKLLFLITVLLVAYAAVSIVGTSSTRVEEPPIPNPMTPDPKYRIRWETEQTMLAGHFGDFWKGVRDPFFEKPDITPPEVTGIELPGLRLIPPRRLKPVPSFIGAPPIEREVRVQGGG